MSALVSLATALATLTLLLHGQVAGNQARRLTMSVSTTAVSPGDSIEVTIASPAGESFRGILLIGTAPIGMAGATSSLPAKFSVRIPPNINPGKYALSAMAVTTAGEELMTGVELAVDPTALPLSLAAVSPTVEFARQGDELPMTIHARYSRGEPVDVTHSDRLTFRSLNPKIAIVDSGQVLAIGPGTTTVIGTFAHPSGQRQISIPVTVPAPPFGITPNPLDFGNQAIGRAASAQYTITNTTAAPLKITKVVVPHHEFTGVDGCVSASPLAPGASCSIRVAFTPARPGTRVTFVRLETEDEAYGLSMSGTGTAPATRR